MVPSSVPEIIPNGIYFKAQNYNVSFLDFDQLTVVSGYARKLLNVIVAFVGASITSFEMSDNPKFRIQCVNVKVARCLQSLTCREQQQLQCNIALGSNKNESPT